MTHDRRPFLGPLLATALLCFAGAAAAQGTAEAPAAPQPATAPEQPAVAPPAMPNVPPVAPDATPAVAQPAPVPPPVALPPAPVVAQPPADAPAPVAVAPPPPAEPQQPAIPVPPAPATPVTESPPELGIQADVGAVAPIAPLSPADAQDRQQARAAWIAHPIDIYAHSTAGQMSPAVAGALERVYVPNIASQDVYVIDPATLKVVDHFRVGRGPQHVVPSWDLQTLWVTGSAEGHRTWGSLTAIDPRTAKLTRVLEMEDAYNMYFTPDGASAIVVAESRRRLEFRDPHTMALQSALTIPECAGINHADFTADGRFAVFTCEFTGAIVKIDVAARKTVGFLRLAGGGMPQDVRSSPDGQVFYVANMMTDGVSLIDVDRFVEIGFIPTGVGAHGLYPSRDGTRLYVSNRGSHAVAGAPHGKGGVSVIDFRTNRVVVTWPIPGGGSPDMGNVNADGTRLWLSGRFDNVVYAIDTALGTVTAIPVGHTPHGLTVWPQPGRYSLGHTGVMR